MLVNDFKKTLNTNNFLCYRNLIDILLWRGKNLNISLKKWLEKSLKEKNLYISLKKNNSKKI